MKQIGIVGGAGYTAGELLRILVHHPEVEVAWITSKSQAGRPVAAVHDDLVGLTDLIFIDTNDLTDGVDGQLPPPPEAGGPKPTVDAIFLCMGHGKSAGWMAEYNPPVDTLVIDLSTDFRDHDDWTYGLPEVHRDEIERGRRIANPGCFATAVQLALLPLLRASNGSDFHVNGLTGSTGAGQQPTPTTHFSWRNHNVSVYKAFEHQHLREIGRTLRRQGRTRGAEGVHFLPQRGPFARGIFVTAYTHTKVPEAELRTRFCDYYANAAFTHVTDENPHLKQVVNTNNALVHVARHGDLALAICCIDNLLKGASGQAVQNMNLALGLPEDMGLRLKAGVF